MLEVKIFNSYYEKLDRHIYVMVGDVVLYDKYIQYFNNIYWVIIPKVSSETLETLKKKMKEYVSTLKIYSIELRKCELNIIKSI